MRIILLAACVFMATLAPAIAGAQETLTVGMGFFDKNSSRMPVVESVFAEAYRRAGLKAEFVYASNMRDVADANNGILDSTMGGSLLMAARYPNLVPLEVPMSITRIAAMKNDFFIWANSWKNLRPLRLVTLEGDLTSQILAERHNLHVTVVKGYDQAFKMIKAGRMDAVLCNVTVGSVMARKLGYEDMDHRDILYEGYAYHLLNKKHAAHIPALSKAWRSMLEDGSAERLAGPYASALPDLADESAWSSPVETQ